MTLRNVPSFLYERDRARAACGCATSRSAATSTRWCRSTRSIREKAGRVRPARRRDHGRRQRGPAGASRGPADLRLSPRRLPRARARRGARPQRDLDPSRLARPLAVRHRHLGADGGAARARRARARRAVRQRVGDRHAVHRAAGRGDPRRRLRRRGAGDHRPRVGHGSRAPTCSTPTTRSPPASRSDGRRAAPARPTSS